MIIFSDNNARGGLNMKTVAVRHIERADSKIVHALGKLGVATVHEA